VRQNRFDECSRIGIVGFDDVGILPIEEVSEGAEVSEGTSQK
jgi:hypothetical protein